MLCFVVPVKSRKVAKSWSLLSNLLERTLRSICNQTSANFRVVVVCNEMPEVHFEHSQIEYLQVDFQPPISAEAKAAFLRDGYDGGQVIAIQDIDKARRIWAGLDYAQKFNPTHSMVVDADDCVSCHLAEFVEQHPQSRGWLLQKGYVYPEGGRFAFINRKTFYQTCGTSVIFNYKQRHQLFCNPNYYAHCSPINEFMFEPLPFMGALYSMSNRENIYMNSERRTKIVKSTLSRFLGRDIRSLIRKITKYQFALLTEAIHREFGLYAIDTAIAGGDSGTGKETQCQIGAV